MAVHYPDDLSLMDPTDLLRDLLTDLESRAYNGIPNEYMTRALLPVIDELNSWLKAGWVLMHEDDIDGG